MSRSCIPISGRPEPDPLGLDRFEPLQSVHQRDLARLDRLLPTHVVGAAEPLPAALAHKGYVYLIRRGRLALLDSTPSGRPIMIAVLGPGSFWSTLGSAPCPDMVTLQDVMVAALPESTLRRLIARYPQVGVDLAGALSGRLALLRDVVADVGELKIEDRLWARLVQLGAELGVATRSGARLDLALTHAQWALLVGGSRESVTIAMGHLRGRGLIRTEGRTITIPWTAFEEATRDPRRIPPLEEGDAMQSDCDDRRTVARSRTARPGIPSARLAETSPGARSTGSTATSAALEEGQASDRPDADVGSPGRFPPGPEREPVGG